MPAWCSQKILLVKRALSQNFAFVHRGIFNAPFVKLALIFLGHGFLRQGQVTRIFFWLAKLIKKQAGLGFVKKSADGGPLPKGIQRQASQGNKSGEGQASNTVMVVL